MKKTLLAILISAVLFGALFTCCFDSNGQIAYAENGAEGSLDADFGLPTELQAKSVADYLYGEGLSFLAGQRRVFLYVHLENGKPVGVRFAGMYFGASGIEVTADVYSSNALEIDFKINAKAADLTSSQLQTRNTLVTLFTSISQMIDEVDSCANTTYDGANGAALSDIYRFNNAASDVSFGAVAVDGGYKLEIAYDTYRMLQLAQEMYLSTDGAFNPAVYRLVDLWGFSSRIFSNGNFGLTYDREVTSNEFWSSGYPLPDKKFVDAFSDDAFTDFSADAVELTASDGKYYVTKKVAPAVVDGEEFEQWLDLGGIAKGYAVDRARAMLKELGVDRFFVNAGSSSMAAGNGRNGGNIQLGMVDAFDEYAAIFQSALFSVDIGKSSVSTSGQYIRKYTVNGIEYAHILDGTTGAPAQTGVRSVMVVVPEEMGEYWAAMGDCLTTALTVMGREGIVNFANSDFVKDNRIKFVVQYETLDGRKQLLSNYMQDELSGVSTSFAEFGWALKTDEHGSFYYDADATFTNPTGTYTVLLAVLGAVLVAGAVALVVYHLVRGKRRVVANVVSAKKDKPFKLLDIMLYLGVLLVILVLFYVFIFDTDNLQMQTVAVYDDETGETLFLYNVTRNEYIVNEDNLSGWVVTVEQVEDGIKVTLTREIGGDAHFNTLKITRGAQVSVQMIDSVCGFHQDCVRNFPAVTRAGGAIVCSPNRLKIVTG